MQTKTPQRRRRTRLDRRDEPAFPRWRRGVLGIVALALSTVTAAQSVLVVDQSGATTGAYSAVQAAVDAAIDGDVILVRAGVYDEAVVVLGKSVTLQADRAVPTDTVALQSLRVQNLAGNQPFTLRGIDLGAVSDLGFQFRTTLILENNAAPVQIEDVWFSDESVFFTVATVDGIRIEDCASVCLTRIYLTKVSSLSSPSGSPPRIDVSRSTAFLFDSHVDASETEVYFGGGSSNALGESGVRVIDGFLGVYETYVKGGLNLYIPGSGHSCPTVTEGPAGIDALRCTLTVHDSTILGGGRPPFPTGCPSGPMGPAIALDASTQTTIPGEARTHVASSPVREDGTLSISFVGIPGDLAWGIIGMNPGAGVTRRSFDGPLLLSAPIVTAFVGTVPASGVLDVSVPIGELGLGVSGVVVHAQGTFFDPAARRFVLSEPTAVTLLDRSL